VQVALNRLLESEDPVTQDGASRASQAVVSIWSMEDETHVAAVFVVPEERGVHAEVNVVESATGRLLLACSVRDRQAQSESGCRVSAVQLPQR